MSKFAYSQKHETNLTIQPMMTFLNSKTAENKIAFGFSSSIQKIYNLNNYLAIGSEISYSFENYKLMKDFDGASIPEAFPYYESKLTIQSLSIPLFFRLRTKSNWSLNIGYGLTYAFRYTALTEYVYNDWFINNETRTEIPESSVYLNKKYNPYFSIGLLKTIDFKKINISAGIYYNYNFSNYRVEHSGANNTYILYFYDTNLQYFGFKIGVGIKK